MHDEEPKERENLSIKPMQIINSEKLNDKVSINNPNNIEQYIR